MIRQPRQPNPGDLPWLREFAGKLREISAGYRKWVWRWFEFVLFNAVLAVLITRFAAIGLGTPWIMKVCAFIFAANGLLSYRMFERAGRQYQACLPLLDHVERVIHRFERGPWA